MDTHEKMNHHDEWYAKINPEMLVPTLSYNGETMIGSRNMITYLNEKHPEKQLIPFDEANRAKVESYIETLYENYSDIRRFTNKKL